MEDLSRATGLRRGSLYGAFGLVVATHRGFEALARGGVDTAPLNRIADAAIDGIRMP